jgi:hypothetical protein
MPGHHYRSEHLRETEAPQGMLENSQIPASIRNGSSWGYTPHPFPPDIAQQILHRPDSRGQTRQQMGRPRPNTTPNALSWQSSDTALRVSQGQYTTLNTYSYTASPPIQHLQPNYSIPNEGRFIPGQRPSTTSTLHNNHGFPRGGQMMKGMWTHPSTSHRPGSQGSPLHEHRGWDTASQMGDATRQSHVELHGVSASAGRPLSQGHSEEEASQDGVAGMSLEDYMAGVQMVDRGDSR